MDTIAPLTDIYTCLTLIVVPKIAVQHLLTVEQEKKEQGFNRTEC